MGLDHGLRRGSPLTSAEYESESYDDYRKRREATEIITWRKSNHFHKWFVEHVQGDVDDCEDHEVSVDQLRSFAEIVSTVLAASELVPGTVKNGSTFTREAGWRDNLSEGQVIADATTAQKLLPTTNGFFFGSTDYDEWYYRSLVEALQALEPVLAEAQPDDKFSYWSSW